MPSKYARGGTPTADTGDSLSPFGVLRAMPSLEFVVFPTMDGRGAGRNKEWSGRTQLHSSANMPAYLVSLILWPGRSNTGMD